MDFSSAVYVHVPVMRLDSGWDPREFFILAGIQNCVFSGL